MWKKPTILIAGFLHETNTFANAKATLNDFKTRNGNTELFLGEQVLELENVNVSIGGFIRKAKEFQWGLAPVLWASACPSAEVLEEAYWLQTIKSYPLRSLISYQKLSNSVSRQTLKFCFAQSGVACAPCNKVLP